MEDESRIDNSFSRNLNLNFSGIANETNNANDNSISFSGSQNTSFNKLLKE
jgi:hypothetical protein